CTNFCKFLIEGTKPNLEKIKEYVDRSLMLVTALSPVIGYDKASKIAHYALDNDLSLKAAALKLGFVSEAEFDRIVDPANMVRPSVAPESPARCPAASGCAGASMTPLGARPHDTRSPETATPAQLAVRASDLLQLLLQATSLLFVNAETTEQTVAAGKRI